MKQEEPWIGFVHVQPRGRQNPLGDCIKGAFTHVIALAAGREAFIQMAYRALEEADLRVVEINDVASVADYRVTGRISEEMEALVSSLSSAFPVQFDIFDTYRELDA